MRNRFAAHFASRLRSTPTPPTPALPSFALPVLALAALALVATACGSISVETGSTTTSDVAATTTTTGQSPDGGSTVDLGDVAGDEVVFAVERGGGFQMLESSLRTYPDLVIFADGRVVRPAEQPAVFPGPALPLIEVAQIPVADVEELLIRAIDSGVFADGVEFGQPNVADAGSTTVTAWIDGALRSVSAEALGIGPGADLKAAALQARTDLRALIDAAMAAPAAGVGEPYEPQRWLVYSTEFLAQEGVPAAPVLTWPLSSEVFDRGADRSIWCAELTAEEAEPVLAAAVESNEVGEWLVDGESRTVVLTPRFAHQNGCPR